MELASDDIRLYDQNSLMHYGVKRRSGRYPWGSGEDPYQHSGDWLSRVDELKKQGFAEKELARIMMGDENASTTEFRYALGVATNDRRRLQVERARSLAEDGLGASAIGREMGLNESTVRSLLNKSAEDNMNRAQKTADKLKEEIATKKMVDVGAGVERELGVSKQKLDEALWILEAEGYNVVGFGVQTGVGKQTNMKVLCEPGDWKEQQRSLYKDPSLMKNVGEYTSRDGGATWDKREYPASINSKRVMINYAEDGGIGKDGVIEIRPGVKDLDLGNSHYAQVRIMVDGTHYLKGMAMYADDLPDGVDIRFNTNKKRDTPKMDVLKPIKDDPDNPFGAYIKADGQSYYFDPRGKYTDPITGKKQSLSAINKLKEEGDWEKSSVNLSSQFLSKQPLELIKKQLSLTYADYADQYDEIMSNTNPTVRKKLLYDFADSCDSATVHLKAAALPRQATRVILPLPKMKENEIYAPYLRNGEKVCLVRYPHGGIFEIPELTVNNKNPTAKKTLGNAIDAVGINSKVAERLSGADFDGDTVVVIPVNSRVRVNTSAPLKGLIGFDPKDTYGSTKTIEKNRYGEEVEVYRNAQGVKFVPMSKEQTQKQMGIVSNLITDMTLAGGATEDEITRAVKHSMVVIDAAKHKLDYKQSERDNNIAELKRKYQPKYDENGNVVSGGGAHTLLSRRKQTVDVPEHQGGGRIDPDTGKVIYRESGRTYVDRKTGEVKKAMTKVNLLNQVDDVRTLSSGTRQENAYADYANKMKALANQARKEYAATERLQKNPSATKAYEYEVKSLDAKLNVAEKNAPRERRARALADSVVKAKLQEYPDLKDRANKKELNKVKRLALDDARAQVGASGKQTRITITDKEWEAIQAGAISDTKLSKILRYSDPDRIKELSMPKQTTTLSPAKANKITQMKATGYTIAEIADSIGVSTSTVSKYLNN